MKKYTFVSFVFILSLICFGFLGFTTKSVNGQSVTSPCSITVTLRVGSRGAEVMCLQSVVGATRDGVFGSLTRASVMVWQRGHGLVADGIFGPKSRAAWVANITISNPNSPVISGVSGPQSLNVNQQGTWTVTAHDPSGGNLSYSVIWGDEVHYLFPAANGAAGSSSLQQSATFTHSYSQRGVYTPTFTVRNNIECVMSPCPNSASTSVSVNVGNVAVPPGSAVTVLSPNGGESWAKGTTHTISWQDITPLPAFFCPPDSGSNCDNTQRFYDIQLVSYYPPCLPGYACPNYMLGSHTIASSVSGFSYQWPIPNCTAANPCSSNFEIPTGTYKIQVCQVGTTVCDSSDRFFNVVNSGSTSDTSPTISSLSPTSGVVGTQVTIHGSGFTATGNKIAFGNLGSQNNPDYSLNSADGQTLVFFVPSTNYFSCWNSQPACEIAAMATQPGDYAVSVMNAHGTSNAVNFYVSAESTGTTCDYAAPPLGYHYVAGPHPETCDAYLVKDSSFTTN